MTKTDALKAVVAATAALAEAQGGSLDNFRAANANLAIAQLNAASAGAFSSEIMAASEWNGVWL